MQLLQLQKESLNKFNDLLPVGLLVQLEKPSTGIAEVKGSNSVQAWIFFQAFFSHYKSCVYNCDDPLSYYAPINVNPVRGGGGSVGKGWGFDAWDYPRCRAFDRAKRPRGRDIWLGPTEAWYWFLVSIQKRLPGPFLEAFWKSRRWRKVWSFHLF